MTDGQQLLELVRREAGLFQEITRQVGSIIVGQDRLVNRMLIAFLCSGHVLIEGVPGLAKTLAVRTLASTLGLKFQRIQFTPDLLPSDIIGTQVYNPRTGDFTARTGPLFASIVLADEINRAPAKVQSALLEAMEERQVTLGEQTHVLPNPFMVLATQNPIEQEGTYLLPEAQLDRFMLKVVVEYPNRAEERLILDRMSTQDPPLPQALTSLSAIIRAQEVVKRIYVDDKIKEYVLNIIFATRDLSSLGVKDLVGLVEYGASPRATLSLIRAAKASAFLRGRGYVTPDDVKQIAFDVLRHRLVLSFEAQAEGLTSDKILERLLSQVPVP